MIRVEGDQGSEAWVTARLGIPTASNFGRIITPKTMKLSAQRIPYMAELLAEWLTGEAQDQATSQFMDRGSEMEMQAVSDYEWDYECDVDRVGLCLRNDRAVGASPDGLVGDDGLLEIKILAAKNHVLGWLRPDDDEHKAQIQGQLWVTHRRWCHRLYWHPTIKPMIVLVGRDEEFIRRLSVALLDFVVELEVEKQRFIEMGHKPKPPKADGVWCHHRNEEGRFCFKKAGLEKVDNEWRCVEHRDG